MCVISGSNLAFAQRCKANVLQRARLFALSAILFSSSGTLPAQEWKPMFNGSDLDGWTLVNTPAETWSFEGGVLICTGKPIGEIRTNQMYQNFEMEIEWRHMVPRGNAGIFVWADDITARGVPFHRGIEVQVLENAYGNTNNYSTHGDIFPIHGADMTPVNGRGGNRAFPIAERSLPSPQWNHYRIVCSDGNISLAVNGEVVTNGRLANPRKGYICIESEGGVVHYRNARIRELPNTNIDPKMVATRARGFRSLYSGLDLRGWTTKVPNAWQAKDWILAYDGSGQPESAMLESEALLDMAGFVLDFRFLENTQSLAIELPGAGKPLVFSKTPDSPFGLMLEDTGKWNRVVGSGVGSRIELHVNKRTIMVEQQLQPGRLRIIPSGPTELSNIFVR